MVTGLNEILLTHGTKGRRMSTDRRIPWLRGIVPAARCSSSWRRSWRPPSASSRSRSTRNLLTFRWVVDYFLDRRRPRRLEEHVEADIERGRIYEIHETSDMITWDLRFRAWLFSILFRVSRLKIRKNDNRASKKLQIITNTPYPPKFRVLLHFY